jgi:hypothetical protein
MLLDYLNEILGIYYFIFAVIILIIQEFINYFYIPIVINSSSNTIPKLKSCTIFNMEPLGVIKPSNISNSNNPNLNNSIDSSGDSFFKKEFLFKCRVEFKEFCKEYKGSIKLSANKMENLNNELANAYYRGASFDEAINMLPSDIKPLYREFLQKQYEDKTIKIKKNIYDVSFSKK